MSKRAGISTLALVATVVVAGTAFGAGPWPGFAQNLNANGIVYASTRQAGTTTLTATQGTRVLRTAHFKGSFGIPAITLQGLAGGLSVNGRLLVLAEAPNYEVLKRTSHFLVVRAPSLRLLHEVTLNGDFGYDALSPDGRTLYLLQHRSVSAPDYAVRAYDLVAGRLLEQAIVDRRNPDEKMNGIPVARTTSSTGAWVYTLYSKQSGGMFVHALNAKGRSAFCVDFTWSGRQEDTWLLRLALSEKDHMLTVLTPGGGTAARIDTKTLSLVA
jgi:hypothetical protein